MKILLKTLFLALTLTLIASCSKDSDSDSTSCIPIACENGGTQTTDCGCDCPERYEGFNCNSAKTPLKVIISKVVVTSFSNFDSFGNKWDAFSNADIFFTLKRNGVLIHDNPIYTTNAEGGTITYFPFNMITPFEITQVNEVILIQLWDYDLGDIPSNENDLIGTSAFFPFNSYSFPSSVTATSLDNKTSFEIFLSYEF